MNWPELGTAVQELMAFIVSDWRFWVIFLFVTFTICFWAWCRKENG